MRKNKLKGLSALLAVMLLVTASGCGEKKKAASGGETPTLLYLVPGDHQVDEALIEEKINEITEPLINAKVDIQFIDWAAWGEKTNMMLASNEYFDISSGYGKSIGDLVKNGSALVLDELLDTEATTLRDSLEQYFWDAASVDGNIYVVPNEQIEAVNTAVLVRKDLMDKYNFDISKVEKVMDLEPFWKAVKENEEGVYPFKLSGANTLNENDDRTSSGYNNSVSIDWETLKVTASCESEELRKAAELAYEIGQKGYLRPDRATATDTTADMAAGRYASFTDMYKPGIEQEYKNKNGYEWVCKSVTQYTTVETWPLATKTYISANTKYPVESIKFIELLNTNKELYNLICFGIEGKHYNVEEDGRIKPDSEGGYFPNSAWVFGNQLNALVQVGQELDVWEETKELNNMSIKSPLMGIQFDTSEITLELAQLSKIASTYKAGKINHGIAHPDEYWDDYVAESKKAGIDKVVEFYQKAVDEFMANKNK